MSSNHHQQGVILRRMSSNSTTSASCARFAEVAGGTAVDCAVICCCCPFGILNIAILVLYTIPAGICRKLFRKKRRKSNKQQQQHKLLRKGETAPAGVVVRRSSGACVCGCEAGRQVYTVTTTFKEEEEVKRLEKEMWDTFFSTGFWRSPSQRHNS